MLILVNAAALCATRTGAVNRRCCNKNVISILIVVTTSIVHSECIAPMSMNAKSHRIRTNTRSENEKNKIEKIEKMAQHNKMLKLFWLSRKCYNCYYLNNGMIRTGHAEVKWPRENRDSTIYQRATHQCVVDSVFRVCPCSVWLFWGNVKWGLSIEHVTSSSRLTSRMNEAFVAFDYQSFESRHKYHSVYLQAIFKCNLITNLNAEQNTITASNGINKSRKRV